MMSASDCEIYNVLLYVHVTRHDHMKLLKVKYFEKVLR